MKVVIDCEANALYQPSLNTRPTKIHCVVAKECVSGAVHKFAPGHNSLDSLPDFLSGCDLVIGHNIIRYDRPLIRDCLGYSIPRERTLDTLVLSRLCNSVRPAHSVEYYGKLLGRHKPSHEDWSQYSPEMLHRCCEDVEIQLKMYFILQKEFKSISTPRSELDNEMCIQYILHDMTNHGFPFDLNKALELKEFLQEKQIELGNAVESLFPPIYKPRKATYDWSTNEWNKLDESVKEFRTNKNGSTYMVNQKWLYSGDTKEGFFNRQTVGETWSEVEPVARSFTSGDFLVHSLVRKGWKPVYFSKGGKPQITEEALEHAANSIPEADILLKWRQIQKRLQDLTKWIGEYNNYTGCIHGEIIHIGTRTHRMAHTNPPLTQATSLKKPYGPEMRELFTATDDTVLVGTDASGIQGRILGHYLGSGDYIDTLVNKDIHNFNLALLNLPGVTRSSAKTFYYAWLLGCGIQKASIILGCSKEEAKAAMQRFIEGTPGLQVMLDRYSKEATKGYVISDLTSRQLPVDNTRSNPYKGVWHGEWLSSFLQGDEAAIMKLACKLWSSRLDSERVSYQLVYWNHDEWQTITKKEDAKYVGQCQIQAIVDAGKFYNCKCPLDGETKVGNNWKETH